MPRTLETFPEPALRPCYDINKSYNDNAERGPHLAGPMPERAWPPRSQWMDFLGYKVASHFGVASGALFNAKWVCFAAQLGFDVLTYHTIRCRPMTSQTLPNMFFVDVKESQAVLTAKPSQVENLSVASSFGRPSREPDFLHMDIESARECLRDGQVLIVSIYGTGQTPYEIAADFVRAATIARESGAQIIEADFSELSSEMAPAIAKAIVQCIGSIPLLVNLGALQQHLHKTLVDLAKVGVRGFSGITSIPMKVLKPDGFPILPNRPTAQIRGSAIRSAALLFIQQARQIIESEKLDTVLVGSGGIVSNSHFQDFIAAGADIAMSTSGFLWDPYVALR